MQIAAVNPERFLVCGLPHVAQFALPRTRVAARIGTEAPDLAHLIGDIPAEELGDKVIRSSVAGGEDDQVGWQLRAVGEDDRVLGHTLDTHAALELDSAVDNEVASPRVDVVTAAYAHGLEVDARAVLTEIENESDFLQLRIEVGVDSLQFHVRGSMQ